MRDVLTDESGRLAEDVACRSCGYNLRGIAIDGACPECFNPVERSIQSDLLQFCDAMWLARVAQGSRWIAIGTISNGVFSVVSVVVFYATWSRAGGFPIRAFSGMFGFLFSALTVLGVWFITTPDPGEREIDSAKTISIRTLARWMAMSYLLSAPLSMLGGPWLGVGVASGSAAVYVQQAMMFGLAAITAAATALMLAHLRRLALRVPRPGLAR